MGRTLITLGLLLVLAGLVIVALERMNGASSIGGMGLWSWIDRLRLGRLPGDIRYRGRHVTVFAPLGTSLVLSVLVTLALLALARLRR